MDSEKMPTLKKYYVQFEEKTVYHAQIEAYDDEDANKRIEQEEYTQYEKTRMISVHHPFHSVLSCEDDSGDVYNGTIDRILS